MLSTFIRFKGRGLILELIKEDIAENCIPMEVVGLFDEEESGCDDFVNVVDVKALFEENPSRDRAECGVMSEVEERVVNAADELARHGVTKMVLHIPDTFRLYREAFIKSGDVVEGWRRRRQYISQHSKTGGRYIRCLTQTGAYRPLHTPSRRAT